MGPNMFQCAALVIACLAGSALATESRAVNGGRGMTLAVQNRHHKSIVMSDDQHILMPEDSTLATGEYKVFTTGPWSGNFKVNEEEHGNTGQDTLVEFTVNDQGITIDVSYIAGYTVPVVCGCQLDDDKNVTLVTGCNIDLKKANGGSCPPGTSNGHGGCLNPMRNKSWNHGAKPFFKPCEGAGYTHEGDHETTQNAELCREGPIVCCIGSECPPSIKQHDYNGTAHDQYTNGTVHDQYANGTGIYTNGTTKSGAHGKFPASSGADRHSSGRFLPLSRVMDSVN